MTTKSSSGSVLAQLAAIQTSLASVRSLTAQEREQIRSRSKNVPDTLIEKVLQLAELNDGQVAGLTFDVEGTKAALGRIDDARTGISTSREIAEKLVDQSIQERVVVADRAFAVYRALGRLVKTPEGDALVERYEEMRAAVRERPVVPRKPRAKKEKT